MLFIAIPLIALLPTAALERAAPVAEPRPCLVEVRIADVSPGKKDTDTGHALTRATFQMESHGARYQTSSRVPLVSYSFNDKGWNAVTTFEKSGVRVELEGIGDDGTTFEYDCEITAVLTVVGPTLTPVLGTINWKGTGKLTPGTPLTLRATYRIDRRQLQIPKNHPLFDPDYKAPERDLVKEITLTIKVAAGSK